MMMYVMTHPIARRPRSRPTTSVTSVLTTCAAANHRFLLIRRLPLQRLPAIVTAPTADAAVAAGHSSLFALVGDQQLLPPVDGLPVDQPSQ